MLDKVVITDDADVLALIFALDKHAFLMPVNLYPGDSGAHGCIHLETLGLSQADACSFSGVGNEHRFAFLSAGFRNILTLAFDMTTNRKSAAHSPP